MLHNTSQIDIERPDLEQYPDFAAATCWVRQIGYQCRLFIAFHRLWLRFLRLPVPSCSI
jgi:hypothetical protein